MQNRLRLQKLNGKLAVRKRTVVHWIVLIVAFWSFLIKPVSALPGALNYLKYLPDGFLFALILLAIGRKKLTFRRQVMIPVCMVCIFFIYTLFVYMFRFQSVAYYLWGFRNSFRFLIAFFAFIAFLDEQDVKTWMRILDVLFWVNLVLSIFQFVVLGFGGDLLGGIFGTKGASNGYTLVLLNFVITKSILQNFQGKEKSSLCIAKCLCAILIAAMAELKFFFVLFIVVLLSCALITRYSWRKMVLFLLAAALIMMGTTLLTQLHGSEGFSWENIWELATKENYSSTEDINRLSAIASLTDVLRMTPMDRIVGLGLGNCDTAAFAVCNTTFYKMYGYLHYTWLTSAMIFLEMGFVGLVFFCGFIMVCGWRGYTMQKKGIGNRIYNQLAAVCAVTSLITMFYNSSLRIEAGYMVYFILALPFIDTESAKEKANIL